MRTLVLDSSYYPIKVITWEKAMILWITGRAEVVEAYEEHRIRSPNKVFDLPKILRLFGQHQQGKAVRFNRQNILYRDDFTCQYCAKKFSLKELTMDHVVPVSRGGENTWQNVVAACAPCNTKKGDKTPRECGMKLLKIPKAPGWNPFICLKIKQSDPQEWWQWFPAFSGRKAS